MSGGAKEGKRKREGGGELLGMKWHRVVLDEAHTIRNRATKAFKACLSLSSTHCWALTGTPIQNKAEDVHSLFEFVRAKPVDDVSVFRQAIAQPIRNGQPQVRMSVCFMARSVTAPLNAGGMIDSIKPLTHSDFAFCCCQGLSRLRVLMRTLCLRRGKDVIASSLPKRTIQVHAVAMEGGHREAYDALFQSAAIGFEALLASGSQSVFQHYSSVLECILRLRQVCDAVELVPPERLQRAKDICAELAKRTKFHPNGSAAPTSLTPEEAEDLFKRLKGAISALSPAADGDGAGDGGGQAQGLVGVGVFECAVCLEDLEEEQVRILRACKHTFCASCVGNIISIQHGNKVRMHTHQASAVRLCLVGVQSDTHTC